MDRDFSRLWIGQAVSVFGSLIGRAALPWCAVLLLHATPFQMALLSLANLVPGVLFGLLAGAIADRFPQRVLLLGTDLLRALLVALLPIALMGGWLSIGLIAVVQILLGTLSTLFDVAYGAYLPSLVSPKELTDANSRIAVSLSIAEILGFGIAGWLFALLGAAGAFWVDAATFVVSAIALGMIRRRPGPIVSEASEDVGIHGEIREGLRFVLGNPLVRALALAAIGLALGGEAIGTMFTLFVTKTIHLEPRYLGMVYAIGGATSLLGGLLAPRIGRRFGPGPSLVGGLVVAGIGTSAIPLTPARPIGAAYAMQALNQLLTDPSWALYDIHATTLRQRLTPEGMRGRVNGVIRVGSLAAQVVSALAAGKLGELYGPRLPLALGAGIICLTGLLLSLSPLRTLRDPIE